MYKMYLKKDFCHKFYPGFDSWVQPTITQKTSETNSSFGVK